MRSRSRSAWPLCRAYSSILAFIGVKLVLHWAHTVWSWVPDVPTPLSLGFILAVLLTVTLTSLRANRRDEVAAPEREKAGVR